MAGWSVKYTHWYAWDAAGLDNNINNPYIYTDVVLTLIVDVQYISRDMNLVTIAPEDG